METDEGARAALDVQVQSTSTPTMMEELSSSSTALPPALPGSETTTPQQPDDAPPLPTPPPPSVANTTVTDTDTGDRQNGSDDKEQQQTVKEEQEPSITSPKPESHSSTATQHDLISENAGTTAEATLPPLPPIDDGASIPPPLSAEQPVADLADTQLPTPTLNANTINEAGEAEHATNVENNAKVEDAILTADAQAPLSTTPAIEVHATSAADTAPQPTKQEEEVAIDPALAEQTLGAADLIQGSVDDAAAVKESTGKEEEIVEDKKGDDQPSTVTEDAGTSQPAPVETRTSIAIPTTASQTPSPTHHTPPSPSSTSALSSVTVSAAPSVAPPPAPSSAKDEKDEDKQSQQTLVPADASTTTVSNSADRKPRSSAGGRSTARRSNGATNATASGSTHSSATAASTTANGSRRSEKPASTSSTGGTSRTRGASSSSQVQGSRQSARSKTASASSNTKTNENNGPTTRPARSSRQKAGASPPVSASTTTTNATNAAANDDSGAGGSGTRRSRRTRQSAAERDRKIDEDEEESEDADEGFTRCICGKDEDETPAFMIQCETCKAWQHGPCVGFKNESDCPDTYYCEQCRPDLHPNMTLRGKKHARSVSASTKAALVGSNPNHSVDINDEIKAKDKTAPDLAVKEKTTEDDDEKVIAHDRGSSVTAMHRDVQRENSNSLPPTATSTGHPSYHRARSSADAAIVSSFLDPSPRPHSPSPGSPGSPGPLSSDGKRPMYPPTSHFAAPQNPKRRSTMNSRESAAFDESIFLANQNAIRESKLMAAAESGASGSKRKRRARDDDEMEIVKEEEEDHSDAADDLLTAPHSTATDHTAQKQPPLSNGGENTKVEDHAVENGVTASGNVTHDEDNDMEEDEESADAGGDANLSSNPRKRRRRRGAGAPFTAPAKKRNTTGRGKKTTNDDHGANDSVDDINGSVSTASEAIATVVNADDDVAGRKRKRENEAEGDEGHSRVTSPDDSQSTNAASHAAAEKTVGQANKRRKASPIDETQDPSRIATVLPVEPAPLLVANLELAMPQPALPPSTEESAAPSPAVSTPSGQQDIGDQHKEQTHAEALTDGLLHAASALKGKKLLDEAAEDDSTPAPPSQVDDHDAANTAANRGIKQPNQYTYKRGGPGSRGGLKGSPSKRAALAAAAEARHGRHRDDTPSTYEDWINQPPSWGLPDHLSHLAHLLPHPSPLPLQVPKYTTSPHNSAAPSPVTPQVDSEVAAPSSTASTPTILTTSSLEPSAKIRFPSRRMSVAEMRKRAKMMLDYLSRVQVDMVDRSNRSKALATVQEGILQEKGHTIDDMPILTPPPSMLFSVESPLTPQSTVLMDELSKQLVGFQEKFL